MLMRRPSSVRSSAALSTLAACADGLARVSGWAPAIVMAEVESVALSAGVECGGADAAMTVWVDKVAVFLTSAGIGGLAGLEGAATNTGTRVVLGKQGRSQPLGGREG